MTLGGVAPAVALNGLTRGHGATSQLPPRRTEGSEGCSVDWSLRCWFRLSQPAAAGDGPPTWRLSAGTLISIPIAEGQDFPDRTGPPRPRAGTSDADLLDHVVVDRLRALRDLGETYSDVILREGVKERKENRPASLNGTRGEIVRSAPAVWGWSSGRAGR